MGETLFYLAIFWGVILMMENTNEYKTGETALSILEECEKTITRNENCILIAKPELNNKD